MSLIERISRFIAAIVLVPFILFMLAFIGIILLSIVAGMIILGILSLFLPLAVLINPDILEIK